MSTFGIHSFGYHGKIPSVGDFVTKRLPTELVNKWDDWLQTCISYSRKEIADQWAKNYMVAPILRFYLQQGLINDMAWFGLVIPSVDSVGRHFPFSIFFSVKENVKHTDLIFMNHDWFTRFEDFALQTLDPNLNLNAWDKGFAAFLEISFSSNEVNEMTIPIGSKNLDFPICIVYKEIGDVQNQISQYQTILPPYKSFWWFLNVKSESFSEIFITKNLPAPECFPRMIGDQSRDWGWVNSIYD